MATDCRSPDTWLSALLSTAAVKNPIISGMGSTLPARGVKQRIARNLMCAHIGQALSIQFPITLGTACYCVSESIDCNGLSTLGGYKYANKLTLMHNM